MSGAVSVEWDGLRELLDQLRNMPADLAEEANPVVLYAAEFAKDEAFNGYPERTGRLRESMTVQEIGVGRFGAGAVVRNRARHAYLFEVGTQARHNSLGANRGSMPAGNVFIPAMERHRREMYHTLARMLETYNLAVSGEE